MVKEPTPQPTVWHVLGIMAVCFFGLLCLYHAVYWFWLSNIFHPDKSAWWRCLMWLLLAGAAAAIWCRLIWLSYFPKKKL
jgi:nitric oxide reductase large subunit